MTWILLAFGLLTLPWWRALWQALLEDIRVATAPQSALEEPPASRAGARRPRPTMGRGPAYAGFGRRRASRARWEGGFGRRNP